MKFCMSARQPKEYIEKVDEVVMNWKDKDHMIDLIEINPELSVVLYIPDEDSLTDEDWKSLTQYKVLTKNKFKVSLNDINYYGKLRDLNIPYFSTYPVKDGYSLNGLIDLGVCAARIAGPLAHQLSYLESLPIEIRVSVNNADTVMGYDPIVGSWFRPEDLEDIEGIDVCEFFASSQKEEQALFRVYAENKEWPGELYLLVKAIPDEKIMNRMIPAEFQKRRSNCGMRCMSGSHCHYCRAVVELAKPNLLRPLKESLENNEN